MMTKSKKYITVLGMVTILLISIGIYISYQNKQVSAVKRQFVAKEIKGKNITYQVLKPDSIMGASATLVIHKKEALLIDTQFSTKDGDNIVKLAKVQGLNIKKIYISYSDPDYYFGTSSIKKAYPNVKIVATKSTINRISSTYKNKQSVWKSTLGKSLPSSIIIPKAIDNHIRFGGEQFNIFGSDSKKQTLYSKKDNILIGGPLVSTGSHLFMADTKTIDSQQNWVDDLTEIQKLNANYVIPSHFGKNETFDKNSILFTKKYITKFMSAMKSSSSSQEIIQKMKRAYPGLPDGSLDQSAKVVTGEESWE